MGSDFQSCNTINQNGNIIFFAIFNVNNEFIVIISIDNSTDVNRWLNFIIWKREFDSATKKNNNKKKKKGEKKRKNVMRENQHKLQVRHSPNVNVVK